MTMVVSIKLYLNCHIRSLVTITKAYFSPNFRGFEDS
jgi:hypothetical protein